MYRTALKSLEAWKLDAHRKPLLLQGARQVGKTWLAREFGRACYKRTVYVNFERETHLRELFTPDLRVERILTALGAFSGFPITAGETLLVFDEIQSAPLGLTALKYFCEDAPEQHVIASDSLLGMNLHNKVSFPVGKVNMLTLYPLGFYEFLLALGEDGLAGILREKQWELLNVFAPRFKECLRYYLYVGGMPEPVAVFAERRDWEKAREKQLEILATYEGDFSKYAPRDIVPRINMVWQSLPAQLAKENKKFIYGVMKEGARAKDFELAIQWLADSGLLLKSFRVSKPVPPLVAYQDLSAFKLFMNDVGLLGAKARLSPRIIIEGDALFTEFKGALAEQFVMQQLVQAELDYIGYWTNDKNTSEVDFVVQSKGEITPVEVKSGENLRAKSFKLFCEKYKPAAAVRTSPADYHAESWMTNVPLYAIGMFFSSLTRKP
jgi:predicted AAA+ superfamily ATPase